MELNFIKCGDYYIDIVKPLWWSKQTATLTDTDLNYLMLYAADVRHFL